MTAGRQEPVVLKQGIWGQSQVRPECLTCTFRASCWCTHLSRAQVPAFTGSSVRDRKKNWGGGSKGWTTCTGVYKGVRAVRPESVAGGGWFEVLWNLECPVGLSQKRNMCVFQLRKFVAISMVRRIVDLRSEI